MEKEAHEKIFAGILKIANSINDMYDRSIFLETMIDSFIDDPPLSHQGDLIIILNSLFEELHHVEQFVYR